MWRRLRVNILLLVGMGYAVVVVVFVVLAFEKGTTAQQAFESVQSALMALVGGSLALAKDLLEDNPVAKENRDG